jgi:hypothetical protein
VDTVAFAGGDFPHCPRAGIVEAGERDYRIVLVTDATSQGGDQGFRGISGIGVRLLSTGQVIGAVRQPGRGDPYPCSRSAASCRRSLDLIFALPVSVISSSRKKSAWRGTL